MYEIIADMSIDIDKSIADKYDIRYVPMDLVVGDETRLIREPQSLEYMHEYYDLLRNKVPTMTSQITPNNYIAAFEPYVKAGRPILYLALSGGLSKTYESALLAIEELKEMYGNSVCVEAVDTLGATGGQGILAEAACINREQGMALSDNAAWLRAHARNIHYWFMVEDLMYLKRGGRVSAATAVVGTALNIKPVLIVNAEGRLETIAKKRGRRMAMKYLLECYKTARTAAASDGAEDYPAKTRDLVYICCTDCMPDAEELKKMILTITPEVTVRITSVSPVIGAHTGPDMLALIHFGNSR